MLWQSELTALKAVVLAVVDDFVDIFVDLLLSFSAPSFKSAVSAVPAPRLAAATTTATTRVGKR